MESGSARTYYAMEKPLGRRLSRAGTLNALPWLQNISGQQFDIHGGGMDLLFPHHESEIAQSTICNHHTACSILDA